MYNNLDSRALGRADCYAQRFMRAGDYRYNVVPGHAQAISTDFPFVVHVRGQDGKRDGQMAQHNLPVALDGGKFSVTPATITIAIGDMAVWNGGGEIPFAVVGEQEFFNSHRMANECGFSHAFGKPGDYHWRDAFGSTLAGVVRVRDPDCAKDKDLRKWRAALGEGSLIMIADGKADRPEIDILTGQTVFFAVVKTPGISITDDRLLANAFDIPCPS